jgi:hypothetical protein
MVTDCRPRRSGSMRAGAAQQRPIGEDRILLAWELARGQVTIVFRRPQRHQKRFSRQSIAISSGSFRLSGSAAKMLNLIISGFLAKMVKCDENHRLSRCLHSVCPKTSLIVISTERRNLWRLQTLINRSLTSVRDDSLPSFRTDTK